MHVICANAKSTISALTMLNFTLPLCHLLKVLNDGVGRQVMERLIPEVLVNLLFPLATFQVWLDVEGHFPLHLFPTQ